MAGFEIEGERYEMPALHTLTLAECEILYVLTSSHGLEPITQERFESADPDWPPEIRREHVRANVALLQRPDFKIALAAIGYRRKHPEVELEHARLRARDANGLEVTVALILGPDETDPTLRSSSSSQTPQSNESSSSAQEKTADSGSDSAEPTIAPGIHHGTTGTTESDISRRGAPPIGSESSR